MARGLHVRGGRVLELFGTGQFGVLHVLDLLPLYLLFDSIELALVMFLFLSRLFEFVSEYFKFLLLISILPL